MTRRDFLRSAAAGASCAAASSLLTACGLRAPGAAQPRRLPRVGYLTLAQPPGQFGFFVEGLRQLAYVDQQTIVLEPRYANGAQDRLDSLAAELVALKGDVLVADGEVPATAAARAGGSVPIVFVVGVDAVASGLVNSLARPGGRLTGLSGGGSQTVSKLVELARQLVPGSAEVGVLWSSDYPGMALQLQSIKAAAQAVGIRVRSIEVKRPEDFEGAFQAAANAKLPALIITASNLTGAAAFPLLADLAIKYHLPTLGTSVGVVKYGANRGDLTRRMAGYVDRILKGAKPADLPIEQPTKFDLVIDLKLAHAIGVTVPPALLAQATEVIQ